MSERMHPYELVFGTPAFEEEAFPGIRQEAEDRGVDVRDREQFIMLVAVGDLMRSMLPDDAPHSATTQFGALVTEAYHFWLAGKRTYALDEAALRALLAPDLELGSWDMAPPAPAGYVQLPRNLVFARIDEGAHAEAVDGFFFLMPGINDPAVPPYASLSVLLVLGLVPHRGGFSVIDVHTPMTAEAPGHFGDAQAREDGTDFSNVLPGGDRLFALTTTLEVLKLAARCFWHLGHRG
jgi:hypothetical protein